MKVYVIVEGEYSDQKVTMAFSLKIVAEQVAEAIEARYIELVLDEPNLIVDLVSQGLKHWLVPMEMGSGNDASPRVSGYFRYDDDTDVRAVFHDRYPEKRACGHEHWTCYGYCWAATEEQAVKIINELRLQWLAEHPDKVQKAQECIVDRSLPEHQNRSHVY